MRPAPMPTSDSAPVLDRRSLRPDCTNCFALCCTALAFSRSADFAVDKPAGTPCRNLASDFSCTIHEALLPRGFRGCTVFDCFGAGQHVSQELFGGISWAADPESGKDMFAAFNTTRQLHEMLWYLTEAQGLSGVDLLGADLRDARLDGADLSRSLYLTQGQLDAAGGSRATCLPADLKLPAHRQGS